MNTETPDKSDLRVSVSKDERGFLKNALLNVRGPAVVVVLVAWLLAVVAVCIWADESGRKVANSLLLAFLVGYFSVLISVRPK